jgi:hypothetical protein
MSCNPEKPGKNRDDVGYKRPPREHQFKPGNNGHGGGRPVGSIDIWARIRRELLQHVPKGKNAGKQYADLVAKRFLKELLLGRWPQMQEMINREEGKVADQNLTAGEMTITVRYVDEVARRD